MADKTTLRSPEQYRDPWMAKMVQENEHIGFYNREFYCLDNFSAFQIQYKGRMYPTVEAAYQAQGFVETAPEVVIVIENARSAHEAKQIAHENLDRRCENWDEIKVRVMEELLRAKISQHPYVRKKLLETKLCLLVEDSPTDSFWGIGRNNDGENRLGKLWMKLREEIVNNPGEKEEK